MPIHIYIYIYIYVKEPETTYLGSTKRIFRIILTKDSWSRQHFINKLATRKNEKLQQKTQNKKTKMHTICPGAKLFFNTCNHLVFQISD